MIRREIEPVIPIEELSPEEKLQKAQDYESMAENMIMYQWQNKYYGQAQKIYKMLFNDIPQSRKMHKAVRIKRSTLLAKGYIKDYNEACRLRDTAQNEDQLRIAINHFETLAKYSAKHPVRTNLIDPKLAEELELHSDVDAQLEKARQQMDHLKSHRVHRNLFILAAVLFLMVGGYFFAKTASFQYALGHIEIAIGNTSKGWARYKKAWQKSGREDWHELYLTTRYQDGVDSFEAGDYDTAHCQDRILPCQEP